MVDDLVVWLVNGEVPILPELVHLLLYEAAYFGAPFVGIFRWFSVACEGVLSLLPFLGEDAFDE